MCVCVCVCVHVYMCTCVGMCVCTYVQCFKFIWSNRAINMFYGGFGSMSYSTSEEPSNIDLEASECTPYLAVHKINLILSS